jgi:hypothetical protein
MSEKEVSLEGLYKWEEMRKEIPELVEMDNRIMSMAAGMARLQLLVDQIFPGHKLHLERDEENPYLLNVVIDFRDYKPLFTGDKNE